MKHLKSFPIFEGNMQDAQYAESVYLNSPEGKDLAAINYYGYRLPRTGYFYVTERYSEYKLEKNLQLMKSNLEKSGGKWPDEAFLAPQGAGMRASAASGIIKFEK